MKMIRMVGKISKGRTELAFQRLPPSEETQRLAEAFRRNFPALEEWLRATAGLNNPKGSA